MTLSLPALIVGWVLAVVGVYYLGSTLLGYQTTEENTSLAAIWSFLFSFGAVSIAGLLAAKAKFASRALVRKLYMYSIVGAAILFLGYMVIGIAAGLYGVIVKP